MKDLLRLDAASRSTVLLIAGRAVGFVSAFAIPVVLARTFDQSEFGTYKQLFLIFGTLYGLAQFGIAESLYYFVPGSPGHAGRHVSNAGLTLVLAGVLCIALLGLGRLEIAGWLSNPDLAGHLPLLAVFLALMLSSAPFEVALVSRRRTAGAALAYALSDVARTVFIVVPALAIGGIHGLLAGAIAFAALRLLAMLAVLRREFRGGVGIDLAVWRLQLAYALPFALAVGIEVVQATLPQYVVASRFDAAAFAIFAVGCLQIPIVDVIATSSGNIMMVRLAEEGVAGRGPKALTVWHDAISRLALVILPLTVFLVLAAEPIVVTLFTSRYLASAPIFALWTLTIVPSVFVIDSVLRAYAQTRFLFLINLLRLSVVAASIGWLVSAWGLSGAVVATLVGAVLSRAAGLARIARLMNVGVARVLPWARLAVITGWALVAAVPTAGFVNDSEWPAVSRLVVGAAIYAASFAVLCCASVRLEDAGLNLWRPLRRRLSA